MGLGEVRERGDVGLRGEQQVGDGGELRPEQVGGQVDAQRLEVRGGRTVTASSQGVDGRHVGAEVLVIGGGEETGELVRQTAGEAVAVVVVGDPEGDHDWAISAVVDLAASDEAGEPVVTVTDVGPMTT